MSPLDRLALVSCFIMACGALAIALYAAWRATKTSSELAEYRENQVQRERRQLNLGPPRGVGERRHAHPDPTVRARRRDADAPRYGQRPQPAAAPASPRARHRHPDEPATTELVAQAPVVDGEPATDPEQPSTVQLPRPGAIVRDQ